MKILRHCHDRGIHHVYIKPRTPRLNGKVKCSHGTDDIEFYRLLGYTDDVDLDVLRERMGAQPVSTVV